MHRYPDINLSVFAKAPELGRVKTRMQPQLPESFCGFKARFCPRAIWVVIVENSLSQLEQHCLLPHMPYPSHLLASSLTPICFISMRACSSRAVD